MSTIYFIIMEKNFLRLKTKYVLMTVLKSVIFGLSCGLLAVGAVLLPLKLKSINIHFGFYILIGVGAALLFGGALFGILFKLRLSDVSIAKKLDKDYKLNERVQTVVEYGEDQSDIVSLLREDTENRLGNLPRRKLGFGKVLSAIWFYVVIGALSLALFITSICIPTRVEPPPVEPPPIIEPDADPKFEYTLELQSQVYDLMRDIMNSNLQEDLKNGFIEVIEDLDQKVLPNIERKSQLDTAIKTAIYAIDGLTNNANSFRKISDLIKEFDENLSKAIVEGVILYKTFSYKLIDLDMVKGLYGRVNANIDDTLERYFTASFEAHKFTDEIIDGSSQTLVHGEAVLEFKNKLSAALTDLADEVDAEDELYVALGNLQRNVNSVYNRFLQGGYLASGLNEGNENSLKLAYDSDLKNSAVDGLLTQGYNCIMDVYVRQKLAEIFGVSITDMGGLYDDLIPEINDPNGGNNEDDPNRPGWGDGDDKYGSNDLIYDTESGEQVEYGKVYNDYYSKVDDRIQSGELPQDLVDFIEEYFKILLNGIKEEKPAE